jgi:hypothetical protein
LVILVSCAKYDANNNGPQDDCVGCIAPRSFSIDASKPEFIVSVFGRKMGTPDAQKIDDYLEAKLSSGDINELTILGYGIEGGASYCIAANDASKRSAILSEMQLISTDLAETAYSITSEDNCN